MLGFTSIVLLLSIFGIIEGEYTYHAKVGGSFNLHRGRSTWLDARMRCHLEGGVLASPLNFEMLQAMRNEIPKIVASSNGEIYVGFHSTFSKGDFYSIEGVSIKETGLSWESHNFKNKADCGTLNQYYLQDALCDDPLPYMCFKEGVPKKAEAGPCGPVDNGYKLDNRTGSCYKFHATARRWSRAFMACSVEDAYLAIINSDLEAQVLKELFMQYPESSILAHHKNHAYIGVQDWGEGGDWQTIHGQSLQAAGYEKFGHGAPYGTGGCLVMRRDALLGDVACDSVYPFICEKRPTPTV